MKTKLDNYLANLLMLVGATPLLFAVYSTFVLAPHNKRKYGIESDGFLSVSMLLGSYGTTLLLCGGGVLWSRAIAKRKANFGGRSGAFVRTFAYATLCIPAFCFFVFLFLRSSSRG